MMFLFELLQVVHFTFSFLDSLSFTQSDFGMDVSGSSRALVIPAPTARASIVARHTAHISSASKRTACSSTAVTPGLSTRRTHVVRSRNDQKMIT